MISYSNVGRNSSEPEAKKASSNRKKISVVGLLEELVAMNATKIELRQCNSAVIVAVNTIPT